VVYGDQRGGTLGYPTANIALDPALVCPADGVYAGWSRGHRAAVSIGTNGRLRGQEVFASEEALVARIAEDVEATRAAERPV
jgi:riboflavin kinase/FMN adenylyltransferase